MTSGFMPAIRVVWHTLTIYLFLVTMFRVLGRRQLGQLNVVDLVIIIVMGSAVETAMVAGDTSLTAGLVSAATLLIGNRIIEFLAARSRRIRRVLSGDPMVLVREGEFIDSHLVRAGMTHDDVLEAIREREECDLSHIKFAVLERDGTVTVVPRSPSAHRGNHGGQSSLPANG